MKDLKNISWPEVESRWKASEDNEIWQEFYRSKGFSSWEDWRWPRKKLLKLDQREWILAEPDNVIGEVRQMLCDATTRWTDFYNNRAESDFGHLKDHPFFVNHKRVKAIRENFPHNSQLIGLRHDEQIILVDGHHRATAIAGMDDTAKPKIQIALADLSIEEFKKFYIGGKKLKLERRILDTINLARSKLKTIT
jgi:hypothetical protein